MKPTSQQSGYNPLADSKPSPTLRLLDMIAGTVAGRLISKDKASSSDSKSARK